MQYVNIFDHADYNYPFQIFIGGRGTGKTYSGLKGCLDKTIVPGKFIYMRRTAKQFQKIMDDNKGNEGLNPFKKLNANEGFNIGFKEIQEDVAGIYTRIEEGGKLRHIGAPIGYGLSLSTVASVRGIDLTDCSDWIYDEFVKEKHEKVMREECDALLNAYETICRNREFDGLPPIRLWLLSNASDIYNPIFVGLNIVSIVERMIAKGETDKYIKERGLAIHLLAPADEFINAKKQTALYKLTQGTKFYDMALNNEFAYNDFSLVGFRNLKGYTPLCKLDDAYIYKKKGENIIYVSYAPVPHVPKFSTSEKQDLIRFRKEFGVWLYPYFVQSKMFFESYDLKEKVLNIIS